MSRRASNRVNIVTESNERPTAAPQKSSHGGGLAGRRRRVAGLLNFRLPRTSGFSTVRFLRRLSSKVASALQLVSLRKGSSSSSSTNTPPPPKKCNMERSRSFVAPVVDSHRSKAIEDCIEFINSSSLQRSNSVSVN
ncbi:hypothetical protein Scep_005588 [Stephania cephalantha]|uniref:Josephin-like protein n=1 Tax=Stephania cephalantha TaxID=152367 RepID=A0AAP0KXQ0_9MAGN